MSAAEGGLPPLTIVEDEYELIADLVCGAARESEGLALLWRELQRAEIVRRSAAPPDLVRLGSPVIYSDAATGALHYARLADPREGGEPGGIALTSLLGAALIGLRRGSPIPGRSAARIEWVDAPRRNTRNARTAFRKLLFRPQLPPAPVDPRPAAGYLWINQASRRVGRRPRRAKVVMIDNLKGLVFAAALLTLPSVAAAATGAEMAEKINWCQMKDPVGLTHLFSVKGDRLQLRDEGGAFIGVTSSMPLDKMVFDFQPRSANPDYGAILSAKCKDDTACVDVKRDTGATWQVPGVMVFVQVECGKALDLAGKSLPQ